MALAHFVLKPCSRFNPFNVAESEMALSSLSRSSSTRSVSHTQHTRPASAPRSPEKTQTAQPHKTPHQADTFEARAPGRSKANMPQLLGANPAGAASGSNASSFNQMLNQYNQLQQQTMMENMEMQKAQAFWNPLESMSKRDATS